MVGSLPLFRKAPPDNDVSEARDEEAGDFGDEFDIGQPPIATDGERGGDQPPWVVLEAPIPAIGQCPDFLQNTGEEEGLPHAAFLRLGFRQSRWCVQADTGFEAAGSGRKRNRARESRLLDLQSGCPLPVPGPGLPGHVRHGQDKQARHDPSGPPTPANPTIFNANFRIFKWHDVDLDITRREKFSSVERCVNQRQIVVVWFV
jgi:hypothetical protein